MSSKPVYRVIFYNQGEIYEVYAREIYQSEMYGFVEAETFIFGESDQVIVNPGEEKLKNEFAGVKRSFIPVPAIIRIDEVESEGKGKVREIKPSDNVTYFPGGDRFSPPPPYAEERLGFLVYFRHWGQGQALVVIHGLFGSMDNLGMITRLLKSSFSVYAVDLPNHGRSSHVANTSLAVLADMLVSWMDDLGLTSAHFLGHSLGGKVAMEVALRYPERVNKLVVADIAPIQYSRRHDDVFAAFNAVNLQRIDSRTDADKAMRPYIHESSIRSFLLKNLERYEQRWRWRIGLDHIINDYECYIQSNSVDQPAFSKPVLFVKGELSDYILPEHKQQILALFPLASVKVIHGTEHWLHAEKPEIFAGIVKRFLRSTSTSKA